MSTRRWTQEKELRGEGGYYESNGTRERNKDRNSRQDYYAHSHRSSGYDYDGRNTEGSYRDSQTPRREREARERAKQKKKDAAPTTQWTKFMHSETKNHMVAVLGEFIGTTMFLFFAFAGAQNAGIGGSIANSQSLMYISLSFGLSLMTNAWIFYRISGGLFNPAVTLALALTKAITPVRAVLIFIAEICGACFAAYLVKVMFPIPLSVQTTLAAGTTKAQGVFIEALCTAELVFTILMLAAEKHKATFIAPIGIGLALFISELTAVYYTGGSLNPARSFGPAAVAHDFHNNHWIYWVGPFLGSLLATFFYWLFKVLEYELANPGQDGDEENDPTQNPDHEVAKNDQERGMEVGEIQSMEQGSRQDNTSQGTRSGSPNNGQHHVSGRNEMSAEPIRSRGSSDRRRRRSHEPDMIQSQNSRGMEPDEPGSSREPDMNGGYAQSPTTRHHDDSRRNGQSDPQQRNSADLYLDAVRRQRVRRSRGPDDEIYAQPVGNGELDRRNKSTMDPDLEKQAAENEGWYTVRK